MIRSDQPPTAARRARARGPDLRLAGAGRPPGTPAAAAGLRLPPVLALTGALVAIWLLWSPRSPDLAAQVYRVALFARDGFSVWDNAWYGGHYLP
ncbi:MAG: hypothetical protein LC720_03255, partial [Actinobacteria bacterium]|nr:hypothetical protein [Actinomycetota bacterium]